MSIPDLEEYIGPVEGRYLRPFVADGDPRECEVALLGYNPTNPLMAADLDLTDYQALLLDRHAFEAQYAPSRPGGKTPKTAPKISRMSVTRRRLARIVEALGEPSVVEINLNSYPTSNLAELVGAAPEAQEAGLEASLWAAEIIRPRLVIAFGSEIPIPDSLNDIADVSAKPSKEQPIDGVTLYADATWNRHPVLLARVDRHLDAKGPGATDQSFANLAAALTHVVGDAFDESSQ